MMPQQDGADRVSAEIVTGGAALALARAVAEPDTAGRRARALASRVSLRQLRGFLAVADRGSFSRAAEARGLSQSALSLSIAELESTLGVTLFERTSRGAALTEAGAHLALVVRQTLDDLDAALVAVHEAGAARRGRVVLAAIESLATGFLPAVLARCRSEFPGIMPVVHDAVAPSVLLALERGEAELGLTSLADVSPALETELLFRDEWILLCSRDHSLAAKSRVCWVDLNGQPCVLPSTNSGGLAQLRLVLEQEGSRPDVVAQASHLAVGYAYVASGLGIAIVPRAAAPPQTQASTIVSRRLHDPIRSRDVVLAWRARHDLSQPAMVLRQLIRDAGASRPGAPAIEV